MKNASEFERARARRIQVGFRWVIVLEVVLVNVAVQLCRVAHREDLILAGVALAVSLHFVPIGYLVRVRSYYAMAACGSAVAIVALLMPAASVSFVGRLALVGAGMGTAIWTTAAYVTLRADRLYRVWDDAGVQPIVVATATERPMDTPAASATRRLAAFGLDYLLIVGYGVALFVVMELIARGMSRHWLAPSSGLVARNLFAFVTLVLPVIVYFAVSEAGIRGATWGKRRMGLRVAAIAGGSLSLGHSLLRSSLKFAPWQIAHVCLFQAWAPSAGAMWAWIAAGIGLAYLLVGINLWGLFSSKRHTLYDIIAGTTVVHEAAAA